MGEEWKTQETLLSRAKDPEDQEAWSEFVHYYEPFIRMILVQMRYTPSDFDDAVQDVLIKIWKSLPDFEFKPERGRFRSWLSRLIRNKVIDRIRSKKTYREHLQQVSEEVQSEEAILSPSEVDKMVESEWQRYITKRAFENMKGLFSGAAIQVFEKVMLGASPKEIAVELDLAPDSVRVLKNRVQKRLIAEVQQLRSELEF